METEAPEMNRLRAILKNLKARHKEMSLTIKTLEEALGEREPDPFWKQAAELKASRQLVEDIEDDLACQE